MLLSNRFGKYEELIYSMDEKMVTAGIDISKFQMEHGAGQFELVMAPKFKNSKFPKGCGSDVQVQRSRQRDVSAARMLEGDVHE